MPLAVTAEDLAAIAGRATPLMPALAEAINRLCPQYDIDTPQELCHFLAQACHETDHFRTLREYASGRAYEGRADLGNTQPGDGPRFRGRGIFQTTGRANYLQLGVRLGRRDLFINEPELLETPEYAVWSACEFWRTRGLADISNQPDDAVLKKKYRGNLIDASPMEYISITINGGVNGLAERKAFYAAAQRVFAVLAGRALRGAQPMRRRPAKKAPAPKLPPARKAPAPKRLPAKKKAVAPKQGAVAKRRGGRRSQRPPR